VDGKKIINLPELKIAEEADRMILFYKSLFQPFAVSSFVEVSEKIWTFGYFQVVRVSIQSFLLD